MFQSPQWGKCSKGFYLNISILIEDSFSPRNGESVLKNIQRAFDNMFKSFSPRNGESVLKVSIKQ